VGQPASDRDLLLVAAGQALHLSLRAGVDLQPLHRLGNARLFVTHAQRPPGARTRAENGIAIFSRTDRSRKSASARFAGDEASARRRWRRQGWLKRAGVPSTSMVPPHGLSHAGQRLEQLILSLTFKCDDAQDFAGMKPEACVGQFRPDGEVLDP
jgi:hypothetical protein